MVEGAKQKWREVSGRPQEGMNDDDVIRHALAQPGRKPGKILKFEEVDALQRRSLTSVWKETGGRCLVSLPLADY